MQLLLDGGVIVIIIQKRGRVEREKNYGPKLTLLIVG
jgi:hypothetical protein